MPDGSADAGSSHRSASRSASSTALRSYDGHRGVAGRGQLAGRHLAGQVPVDRAAARRGEHLLQLSHELLHLLRVGGVGRLGARQGEAERDIRHASTVRASATRRTDARCQLRENSGSVGTLTRMRRRGVTVILGALITALLAVGVMAAPLPYVVLKPGPTVNTLGSDNGKEVIQVTRRDDLDVGGAAAADHRRGAAERRAGLGDPRLVQRRAGGRAARADLPAGPDRAAGRAAERRGVQGLADQRGDRRAARARLPGADVRDRGHRRTAPSAGMLQKPTTSITTVDGTAVTSPDKLTELVQAKPAGTALTVGYTRAGKAGTAHDHHQGRRATAPPRIGVEIEQQAAAPVRPSKIDLDEIGGPSAGLMFTLGIIDKLEPGRPHRRQDHRRHRHDRRRGQRRPDRRHPAEAGRRQGRRRPALPGAGRQLRRGAAQRGAGPADGRGGHGGRRARPRCRPSPAAARRSPAQPRNNLVRTSQTAQRCDTVM